MVLFDLLGIGDFLPLSGFTKWFLKFTLRLIVGLTRFFEVMRLCSILAQ